VATFCLIHGSWHDGSCWEPLSAALARRGHEALAPTMPLDDPEAGFEDRFRPIAAALTGGADPLVVVGHSVSSGFAAVAAERAPVALLVHLCPRLGPFPAPAGAPAVFREGFPFPPKDELGRMVWEPEAAIEAMYPRFAPDVAAELAARLLPVAPLAEDEYPIDGHPDLPTALIYATEDEFFEPEWERFMARELLGVEPIELPGGHFPMLEDPEGLAELLDRLVRGGPGAT
jgi:pimeloyl-ACP methyl ester carboxylesterase